MTSLQNQRGAVLITALIILALLTIIGIAATNTSTLETMISATEKTHVEAFHAAEAGVEHLRRNFKNIFVEENKDKFAAGTDPDWDFALAGPDDTDPETYAASGTSYEQAGRWIFEGDLNGNYLYNVYVWNNQDGGNALDDKDGVIYMRADAQVPNGGSASIEILLHGDASGGSSISGYGAQEGGGAGKNYSSRDVDVVDANFSSQIQ